MADFMTQVLAFSAAMRVKGIKTATKFISPTCTVRLTDGGKHDGRRKRLYFAVAFGAPNYAERQFIKACQKAGEKFPVKKVQFKFRPVKKK